MAAATVLAERGARVTLLEKDPVLGGRVGGWTEHLSDGEPFEMSRGFHAFFRQYRNLRALLRRVDPDLHVLQPVGDYALLGADGARESFVGLPRHPPLNAIALMWRSPTIGLRDLRTMDGGAAREMMRFDPDRTYERLDGDTATAYLERLRMPPAARRMLFEVFSRSFFDPPEEMSAAELLMRFHLYFMGTADGLLFDVVREPFSDALWRPFSRHLEQLGVDLRLETEVQAVEHDGTWRVHTARGVTQADGVVLAVTVEGLRTIVDRSPGLADERWRRAVEGLRTAPPFVVWRLWLDRPTAPGRPVFAGTSGLGPLDNVSLVHLHEGESRRWALRNGGSVVELHAYALRPGWHEAGLRTEMLAALHRLYPETADARHLEERFLVRQDAPAFPPGSHAHRPGVAGPVPGLALAGDFVKLDLPAALMERAVASGFLAANHLLAGWGEAPEPVASVARRGALAWTASLRPGRRRRSAAVAPG